MIKKYLNIVKTIYAESYSQHATAEQQEFEKDINDILTVDENYSI